MYAFSPDRVFLALYINRRNLSKYQERLLGTGYAGGKGADKSGIELSDLRTMNTMSHSPI